jgi:hypothetical protein
MCIPLPYGNPVYISKFEDVDALTFIKDLKDNNIIGFFKAEVVTPTSMHIPVLGVHQNGKLVFPLGVFVGT